MNQEQCKYLAKMKGLVRQGLCRFETRKDRDILNCLMDIGITLDEAWTHILQLKPAFYVPDLKPNYAKNGDDALVFKKPINECIVYIKLKIEERDSKEETVCISFHKDHDTRR